MSGDGVEFIGRTEENNGIQGYYNDQFIAPNDRNTISISQIGAQTAQYRSKPWYASQNIFKLKPRFELNERRALFLLTLLNKQLSVYDGYSSFPKLRDIKDFDVDLPVTLGNQPDYDFMETFITAQEKLAIQRLSEFRKQQIKVTKAII